MQFFGCRHDVGDSITAKEGEHVRSVGPGTDYLVDVLGHEGLVEELGPRSHDASTGKEGEDDSHLEAE